MHACLQDDSCHARKHQPWARRISTARRIGQYEVKFRCTNIITYKLSATARSFTFSRAKLSVLPVVGDTRRSTPWSSSIRAPLHKYTHMHNCIHKRMQAPRQCNASCIRIFASVQGFTCTDFQATKNERAGTVHSSNVENNQLGLQQARTRMQGSQLSSPLPCACLKKAQSHHPAALDHMQRGSFPPNQSQPWSDFGEPK